MSEQELELPKGWVKAKLEDITELIGGGTPSRKIPEYFDGDIVWLTPTEIPKNTITVISDSREKITELGLKKSSAKIIPKDSVLLTSRASIGYVAISGGNVTTNQGFASFICSNVILNYFLAYWLWSKKTFLESEATGTTFKEISKSKLRDIIILIPPLNEQKRIISKIEELFSNIDSTKQSLEQTKLQLELYRYSLLKDAYEKLVEKHESYSLNDLCLKITDGEHFKPKFIETGIPFVSAKDISETGLVFDNAKYVSKDDAKKFRLKCNPEQNDILMVSRGIVGRTCLVDTKESFCLLGSVILLKPNKTIKSKFLNNYLNLASVQNALVKLSSSTVQGAIYLRDLKKTTIPLPSLQEQEQIVSKIEQGFSLIENTQNIINSTLQTLQTMKMSVLQHAFEGKLVPQDPNDEPAQILLEKIKSTKEAQPAKKRRAKNVK